MQPYFYQYEDRIAPNYGPMSARRTLAWQFLAGLTVGVSIWYLWWRWTASLNPDALTFSIMVALAETLFFVGTLLFFYDIWREEDTPRRAPPNCGSCLGDQMDAGPITVDIFITTFDEDAEVVRPTLLAALDVTLPANTQSVISLLDDGNRPEFANLARELGVDYLRRDTNVGFKAGNLKNALLQTSGDLVVICAADTRLFPRFLQNTIGYFQDPNVAWVQTPHWFYDIPEGQSWTRWSQANLCHLPRLLQRLHVF